MTESTPSEAGLAIHPVLAALAARATDESAAPQAPVNPKAPVKLSGYVGAASQDGMVRLYSSLKDLSFYIEFPHSDVVHVAQAPADFMPDNAVSVWVNAGAAIHWVTEFGTATEFHAHIHRTLRRKARAAGNPGNRGT